MAIGTPTERYAVSRSAQGASTTLSPASTIAANTVAVMCVTTSLAGKTVSSVTDDAGNTWVVDAAFNSGVSGLCISFVSCQVATQLTTSNVITINYGVATNNQAHIWVQEVTGLVTSSVFDEAATGSGSTVVAGTPLTTGNSGTLDQADEIVFVGVRGTNLDGWAAGATYTAATTAVVGTSGLEYKIVAATTAVAGTGTHTSTTNYAMQLVTYKGAAGGATVTGVGSAALGGLAGTASGVRTVTGTGSAVPGGGGSAGLGGLTASATGGRLVAGSAAAALGGSTASATATVTHLGTVSAPLGGCVASAAGKVTRYGVAMGALGGSTATATGTVTRFGVASAPLGALAATATAGSTKTGVGTALLGGLTATAITYAADPFPISVTIRDTGHRVTIRDTGHRTSAREQR